MVREGLPLLRAGITMTACLLLLAVFSGCRVEEANNSNPGYIEGQLLVKYKRNTPSQRIQEINELMGVRVLKVIAGIQVYQLQIPQGTTVPEMIKRYVAFPEVEYAEPNYQVQIAPVQED